MHKPQSTAAIYYLGWIIQPQPNDELWSVVERDGSFSDFETLDEAKRYIYRRASQKEAA